MWYKGSPSRRNSTNATHRQQRNRSTIHEDDLQYSSRKKEAQGDLLPYWNIQMYHDRDWEHESRHVHEDVKDAESPVGVPRVNACCVFDIQVPSRGDRSAGEDIEDDVYDRV